MDKFTKRKLTPTQKRALSMQRIRDELKNSQNLDLESYKPHLRDFFNYASGQNLFEVNNIFGDRKKEMQLQKAYENMGKYFRAKVTSPTFIKHIKEKESV